MNTGMNSLPKWIDQLRVCHFALNTITYKLNLTPSITTIKNYLQTAYCFEIYPARFAAMCMQVHKNGRPSTFADTYELDYSDEFGVDL